MSKVRLVTDDDLSHARQDPTFRYQLVVDNLRLLLDEIHHMRMARNDAVDCVEIREGVKLAVKLSELLQRIAHKRSEGPQAAWCPEPEVRAHRAAHAIANFGLKGALES